jgi:hypothetical protein
MVFQYQPPVANLLFVRGCQSGCSKGSLSSNIATSRKHEFIASTVQSPITTAWSIPVLYTKFLSLFVKCRVISCKQITHVSVESIRWGRATLFPYFRNTLFLSIKMDSIVLPRFNNYCWRCSLSMANDVNVGDGRATPRVVSRLQSMHNL